MGQGKPGKDGINGKDGNNGKDGKDGKDGTNGIGILEPVYDSATGELKFRMTDGNVKNVGNVRGKEGPIGKIDSDESVKKSIADKVLWCADGNICQLPKDVPIVAATGATVIKLNNGLSVKGDLTVNDRNILNSIDDIYKTRVQNNAEWSAYQTGWGGFNAGNYTDKGVLIPQNTNSLNNWGLNIRQGEVRVGVANDKGEFNDNTLNALNRDGLNIRSGKVIVNPGNKENVIHPWGLHLKQGHIYMEGRGDINQPRYIRFYNSNWGKCLDAGTFDESGRGKFNCVNGNLNQLWNYDTSTGQVVNYDSNWNARCLTQDGDKVIMKNCSDGDLFQRWFKDEHHRLRRGNKCLDVGDNNANRLSDCANNDTNSNQVLAFTRTV